MKICLMIARETAWKLRFAGIKKILKEIVDGSLNLPLISHRFQCTCAMPAQHSPDKEPLSLQVPRTLMVRLKRRARALGMSFPSYIIAILSEKTADVSLSSADYEAIAKATRQAEQTGRRCATPLDGAA